MYTSIPEIVLHTYGCINSFREWSFDRLTTLRTYFYLAFVFEYLELRLLQFKYLTIIITADRHICEMIRAATGHYLHYLSLLKEKRFVG